MNKIFIVKKKNPQKIKAKLKWVKCSSLILIYIRQFYATLLPQTGLKILAKVIHADFKAHLCCQNNDNWVTELLRVKVIVEPWKC